MQARSNYAAPNEHTITSFASKNNQTSYKQLLQSMTSANEYINLLQYTLIIMEKNRTLPNEARARFSKWVLSLLYRKLCSLTHNERSHLQARHLAAALHRLGKILSRSSSRNTQIQANHLNLVIDCLSQLSDLGTQEIANTLYGIGQIAATDKLNGLIDENYLNQLLICLLQLSDLKTQGIANSLYGIGQITATDKLNGMIDANHLNQLLIYLPQLPDIKTQHIANTLYGIGQIATTYKLNGMIDANHLNQLLICLPQLLDLNTQGIANCLYGIGQIAATDKLNGLIDGNYLNQLLICLSLLPDLGTQGITNSLYGIGQITAAGNINKLPNQHLIIRLITSQDCHHFNIIATQQIAQALAFLGMTIPQDFLTRLMTRKPNIISSHQHTAINILEINLADTEILPEHLIDSWFVDIYFEYRGKKYILELEGPHHYINSELRSEDALRDKHFEKKGYHVIRIKNEDLTEQVLLDYINADIKPASTGTGLFSSSSTLFSWSAFRNELRLNAPAPESDQRNNVLS